MAVLQFPVHAVVEQIVHALGAQQHFPNPEQILEPQFRFDSQNPRYGCPERLLRINPIRDVDWRAIPPGIHLVHRPPYLYLESNGYPRRQNADGRNLVVPPREADWAETTAKNVAKVAQRAMGARERVTALDLNGIEQMLDELQSVPEGAHAYVRLLSTKRQVMRSGPLVMQTQSRWLTPRVRQEAEVPQAGFLLTARALHRAWTTQSELLYEPNDEQNDPTHTR